MEGKRRSTATALSKDQETELIESYLDEKYRQPGARSNHSKKSKYTSSSKLTKSSLFKTLMRKEDSQTTKNKELDIQIHLLQGSRDNLAREEETFLMRFEKMSEQFIIHLDQLLRRH